MVVRKNVVLVVGAGTSRDFNQEMGTGSELFDNILKRVNEKEELAYLSNILDGLGKHGVSITPQDRIDFSDRLNQYKNSNGSSCSIDDFLNKNRNNKEFLTIGTFAITFHILGYEGASSPSFNKYSWLDALNGFIVKHRLNTWSDRLVNFKIVTFNYDRLIEEFLHRKHCQAIEEFMNNSLVHVYRQVAPLSWQRNKMKSPGEFLMFGHPNDDTRRIVDNRGNIVLMYQKRSDGNDYLEAAKKFISRADVVLFLGYGYDKDNNENLGLIELEGRTFIANYFVPEWNATWKAKFEDFKGGSIWNKHKNQTIYTTETCTDFIRHWLTTAAM